MSCNYKQVKRLPKDVVKLPTGNYRSAKYLYISFVNCFGENVYLRTKLRYV